MASADDREPWLTKRELADRLRVSTRTIVRLQPPSLRVGGQNRYRLSEVEGALERARQQEGDAAQAEPWLDKQGLAAHFCCSIRWIERRMEEGLPHAHIAGRAKFRISTVTPWLHRHGYIEMRGEKGRPDAGEGAEG